MVKRRTPAIIFFTLICAGLASLLGGIMLGLGVYLGSYTDRLSPFYRTGAIAGIIAGATAVLFIPRSEHGPRPLTERALIGAATCTLSLIVLLRQPEVRMESGPLGLTSLLWFSITFVLQRAVMTWLQPRLGFPTTTSS